MAKKTKKQETKVEELKAPAANPTAESQPTTAQEVVDIDDITPPEVDGEEESISLQEIKENAAQSFKDECGVEYSLDGKVLLSAPKDIQEYVVRPGTQEFANEAFSGCRQLRKITIPASVKKMGWRCFWNCERLEEFFAPNIDEEFPFLVFAGCTNLKSVYIPYGIQKIGDWAFEGCSSLRSIYLPNGADFYIDSGAFRLCGLTRVCLPYAITISEYYPPMSLFECCLNLEFADVDCGILPDRMFSGCINLKEVHIGYLKRIDEAAFYYTPALTTVRFKNKVRSNDIDFREIWKYKRDEQEIEIQIPYMERDSFKQLMEQAANVPGVHITCWGEPQEGI